MKKLGSSMVDQKFPLVLSRPNTFNNRVLLVDGQGRSGKNLIGVLLSCFDNVEKMRLDSQLDYIPRYYSLGKMSLDAAQTALLTELDEKYYYNEISRDVNFRWEDYSGVWKQGQRLQYVTRLFKKADEDAVRRLARRKPIFQDMTHDGLHVAEFYFSALRERLHMIHVFRDPVGNIYEQSRRDFGNRLGTDPRELQLTFAYRGEQIPIMASGVEELYLQANAMERLVLIVDQMFRRNVAGFETLSNHFKHNVLFFEFEDFVQRPGPYLRKLEDLVGTRLPKRANRILRREKVPRLLDTQTRVERIAAIRRSISDPYSLILENLISDYDLRPWKGWIQF